MIADIKWLDNPKVFRVNCIPAHSDHSFYASELEAETGENTLVQSLNGMWEFHYAENAATRPIGFFEEAYDSSAFEKISVPCHIEMAGYDKIHYINTMYPWEGHIYRRPAYSMEKAGDGSGMFSSAPYNPVGSYRRIFDLEKGLLNKRVVIRFEGVEQAMYLWLNGNFIGYAEDSFSPSEFDLTPYIREKGNILAVEVHKRSTAAFLEDQDFFRFFGIFRNVSLIAKPEIHMEDMWAKPILQEDETGILALDLKISIKEGIGGTVLIVLKDREGQTKLLCKKQILENVPSEREHGYCNVSVAMDYENIGKVISWDNQNPYLYDLTVKLYDKENNLVEVVPYQIGFRNIEIADKVIYLNGRRLILNGVNRHEWSADSGRCIGLKEMEQDIHCFHRNNINAVRTCHYPDQIPWYFLCDKNGIYVMAETNLESHGSWQKMGAVEPSWNVPENVPQWRKAVLDRAENNFETFKNHVSVLFWSLGNESYAGENIAAMNDYFKEKKDGRLVHYEGVCQNRVYEERISDVESRMYAPPARIKEYLENSPKKPFLLCEYMHNMGNSNGGMDSYIELLDQYKMFQGGFIWDFIDQAIWIVDEVTGKKVLRYGGDFDDRPSDYEFSGNGLLFADRTEKPAMQEVKYYYGRYK